MHLHLLSCEIFFREVCHLVAESPHTIDISFLPKGLHDLGAEKMVRRLQEEIDGVTAAGCEAVLLGYGLCNNGIVGLRAPSVPLVVPRAHDCITLFLGSRVRYHEEFSAVPGTYYRTTGWYEREDPGGTGELTVPQALGMQQSYAELVEQYGEENAQYIAQTMGAALAHYERIAYISLGLACEPPFRARAADEAREKGWSFADLEGDLGLLRRLVDGQWEGEDFLTVPPGQTIAATWGDDVVAARPPSEPDP